MIRTLYSLGHGTPLDWQPSTDYLLVIVGLELNLMSIADHHLVVVIFDPNFY